MAIDLELVPACLAALKPVRIGKRMLVPTSTLERLLELPCGCLKPVLSAHGYDISLTPIKAAPSLG